MGSDPKIEPPNTPTNDRIRVGSLTGPRSADVLRFPVRMRIEPSDSSQTRAGGTLKVIVLPSVRSSSPPKSTGPTVSSPSPSHLPHHDLRGRPTLSASTPVSPLSWSDRKTLPGNRSDPGFPPEVEIQIQAFWSRLRPDPKHFFAPFFFESQVHLLTHGEPGEHSHRRSRHQEAAPERRPGRILAPGRMDRRNWT